MASSPVNTNDSAGNASTDSDTSSNGTVNQSGNLKDSPFGPLAEVVGEDNLGSIFSGLSGGDSSSGGGNAIAGGSNSSSPYGGDPFANFGNPNATGSVLTGGTNPWASLNNSSDSGNTGSSSVSGGDTSASNLFSGGTSGSNPFGGGTSSGGSPFSADTSAGSTVGGGTSSGGSPFSTNTSTGSAINGNSSSSNPFGGGADTSNGSAFGGGNSSSGSNPFSGGSSSSPVSGSDNTSGNGIHFSGNYSATGNSFSGGQLVGSNYIWGYEFGSNTSSSTKTTDNKSITSLGNVIIGSGQWITDGNSTPSGFTSMMSDFVKGKLDSVISKLEARLPVSNDPVSDSGNPFADGKNPFGEGNLPSLTTAGGSNSFADGSNSLTGGSNPFAGSDGLPQQSSFDVTKMIFGDGLSSLTGNGGDGSSPTLSATDILKSVQGSISSFSSSLDGMFASGNTSPLQKPSDLLNLFRADMYSFNNGINSAAGSDTGNSGATASNSNASQNNIFASLFGGSSVSSASNPFASLISSGGQIPFNLLNVALNGLLPFNGSDNVFDTSDGELPIGHGNQDFGSGNAAIGNANWNYGNNNATIGNGNWDWDSSKNNATIGNGNWNLDNSHDNRTVGNANWYWNSTSNNTALGNGNWHFGNNDTTIGNGNWDYGSNNTVIGNGNSVFTNNSIVIGDGNWSVVIDKSDAKASGVLADVQSILDQTLGVKGSANNLVDSFISKMGEAFQPLTGDLSSSGLDSYNKLLLSHNTSAGTTVAI
ncbi:MAG: hypothetical protein PUP91_24520 [Rhizonema sp. PD37]|nr:hypothetical protein [Rhizonema sp. PD37]